MPETLESLALQLNRIEASLTHLVRLLAPSYQPPDRVRATQLAAMLGIHRQTAYDRMGGWYREGVEVFNAGTPEDPSWEFDWRRCIERDAVIEQMKNQEGK